MKNPRQSGNIFFIILLAVVLFAALAFIISRSMRSETTSTMSSRNAELAAADILEYGQRLERAVTKLRQKGISENDIDFTNGIVTGYAHTPVLATTYGVFSTDGGGVAWKKPMARSNDGSEWVFTGETCIVNIGSGGAGCESDTTDNEELLAVLPNVNETVCIELNKRLGISGMPSGGAVSTAKFTGAFADGESPAGVDGKSAGCIKDGANYMFYFTLLAR